MDGTLRTELALPNDATILPMARSYLRDLVHLAGLPEPDGEALVTAALEACANVIDHAYEPGERAAFSVLGEVSPADVTVAVRDQGVPFDPGKMSEADANPAPGHPRRVPRGGSARRGSG